MSKIKTFRGVLADGGIEEIHLQTKTGLMGYKITKFVIMGTAPGVDNYESVVKIYKSRAAATPATATVDFSDNRLLAAATYQGNAAAFNYPTTQFTIFDLEVFNQNIFVSHQDLQNSQMNYYLELTQVKLDSNEATVATLKNIKNR